MLWHVEQNSTHENLQKSTVPTTEEAKGRKAVFGKGTVNSGLYFHSVLMTKNIVFHLTPSRSPLSPLLGRLGGGKLLLVSGIVNYRLYFQGVCNDCRT